MHFFGPFSLLKRIERAKLTFFSPKGTDSRKVPPHHGMTGTDQFMSPLLLHQRWEMSDGIFIFTLLTSIQLNRHPTSMTSPFLASLFLYRGISTYYWPTCPMVSHIFSHSFISYAFSLLRSGAQRILESVLVVYGQRQSCTLGELAIYRRAA